MFRISHSPVKIDKIRRKSVLDIILIYIKFWDNGGTENIFFSSNQRLSNYRHDFYNQKEKSGN